MPDNREKTMTNLLPKRLLTAALLCTTLLGGSALAQDVTLTIEGW